MLVDDAHAAAERVADSVANQDDASCRDFAQTGCTDSNAIGYVIGANVDDGSCVVKITGCMNPYSPNFDSLASESAGAYCAPQLTQGCTDSLAANYNPSAQVRALLCARMLLCTRARQFSGALCLGRYA